MPERGLKAFVDAILGNRRPKAYRASREDAAVIRTAIELKDARPGEGAPDATFVERLRGELSAQASEVAEAAGAGAPDAASPGRARSLSRRRLIFEGASVAAAAAGAVAVDRAVSSGSPVTAAAGEMTPESGRWQTVATSEDVVVGRPVRFATPSAVGFVVRTPSGITALSGACTHQGCLLQLNEPAARLDCPCHTTSFSLAGDVVTSQLDTRPASLPRLAVREHGGDVQVLLPVSAVTASASGESGASPAESGPLATTNL